MLRAMPTCLITVTSQYPTAKTTCAAPHVWTKQDEVLLAWSADNGGTVITDSRGECGQLPLEIPEQTPLVAPITSEGTTEEGK